MPLLSDIASAIQQDAQALEAELASMSGGAMPSLALDAAAPSAIDGPSFVPTQHAFDLMERLRASVRTLESAFTPTKEKHLRLAQSNLKTVALHAAVELALPDEIDRLGGEVEVARLAGAVGANPNKLGNIMRILACEHVFVETRPGVFANSRHSVSLKEGPGGARAMLSFMTGESYDAAGGLYRNLTEEKYRDDFSAEASSFALTVGEGKSFGAYLGEHPDVVQKVILGVVPWLNTITRPALIHDYPWQDLGDRTVVDLGCGPGDVGIDMLKNFPKLRWVFQDLPDVVESTRPALDKSLADFGAQDRAQLVVQDYFKANETAGDVYFLRGVLRDYGDVEGARILEGVFAAMKGRPKTRMLINEIITGPPDTVGPQPVGNTRKHSASIDAGDLMAVNASTIFGGKERSWSEMEALLTDVGFVVEKVHRLRTFTVVIECSVPS